MKIRKKVFLISNVAALLILNNGSTNFMGRSDISIGEQSIKANALIVHETGSLNVNQQSSFNAINTIIKNKIIDYTVYKDYSVYRNEILKDFDGNSFVLVEFLPIGYGIYNIANGDIVEVSSSSFSPYYNVEGDLYYVPSVGYYKKVNGEYVDLTTNNTIGATTINALSTISSELQDEAVNYINTENVEMVKTGTSISSSSDTIGIKTTSTVTINGITYQSADVEVPYSWYFKLNHRSYPENWYGDCGYVALALVLGYMEFFVSTGYIDEYAQQNYVAPYSGAYGTGVPQIYNAFLTHAFGSNRGDSTPKIIRDAFTSYMENFNLDKEYSTYMYYNVFSTVTDPVKDGVPAMYFGNYSDTWDDVSDHVTVVYGYDNDGMLLVHRGHYDFPGDNKNYTNLKISPLSLIRLGGVLAIYNKSSHVHNNYFHTAGTIKRCGCGVLVEC